MSFSYIHPTYINVDHIWDKMRTTVLSKYPNFRDLSFFTRLRIRIFDIKYIVKDELVTNGEVFGLHYTLYYYQGAFYFYKFGF